jgi:hypothetical protein
VQVEAQLGIPGQGPGRVAHQHVDLAGLQDGKALLGGGRAILDLFRIAKDGRGNHPQKSTSKPE